MLLRAINVQGFRSISDEWLENCGQFNVLIGKNNSGKSNILTAIEAFFLCIADGRVVRREPPIGREIDFYQRRVDQPITISLVFQLAHAELEEIVDSIMREYPQVRNAAEEIDAEYLCVTLTVCFQPEPYAYISEITLRHGADREAVDSEVLISIGKDAGVNLNANAGSAAAKRLEAEAFRAMRLHLDREAWTRIKAADSNRRLPLRAYLPQIGHHVVAFNELERLFESVSSFEDLSDALTNSMVRAEEDASTLELKPLDATIATFSGDSTFVPEYATAIIGRLSDHKVLHLAEQRRTVGREEAAKLLSLKVSRGGPEILRSIQETVQGLLGVQIDAFQGGLGRRGESVAELDVDNFLVEVNGSGIREALRLVLDVEFEKPQVLLVEEPEVHLHPALEIAMMRFLKRVSANTQVFITTHSTNFLDTSDMENVYLVAKNESTHAQLVGLEEAQARIPQELGIRLSSLFMYDRLVFVEGPSDEAVMREWASTLGANLSQANVGFVAMGGVRNFGYFANEAMMAFFSKRQVRVSFVVDHDEKEEADIARLKQMVGDRASVHVLQKRELENYLLCPRALADFIALKRQMGGNDDSQTADSPTPEVVAERLSEAAEALRPLAVGKRLVKSILAPLFPVDALPAASQSAPITPDLVQSALKSAITSLEARSREIDKKYAQCEAVVDSEWETRKLDLIPGDELIDETCQKFGIRFVKERDAGRLASLFLKDEIGDEISTLIATFAT
jgi:putative ATP-dependent endonuclease of OLD family